MTTSEMAELDRRIEVMKAYRDGAKIQAMLIDSMSWTTLTIPPAWAWNVADYRIAPEPRKPREFWIYAYSSGEWQAFVGHCFSTKPSATQAAAMAAGKLIHVREVLPD